MSLDERRERWTALRVVIKHADAERWQQNFIAALEASTESLSLAAAAGL
jgi:trehalose-6-phosphate synthase